MYSKLEKRNSEWDTEVAANEKDKRFDSFVDDPAVEAPVVKTANVILAMNSNEKEFEDDDSFVSPPSDITPSHR